MEEERKEQKKRKEERKKEEDRKKRKNERKNDIYMRSHPEHPYQPQDGLTSIYIYMALCHSRVANRFSIYSIRVYVT